MILSVCVALFVALFLLSGRDILIASYSQTASDVVFLFCIKKHATHIEMTAERI